MTQRVLTALLIVAIILLAALVLYTKLFRETVKPMPVDAGVTIAAIDAGDDIDFAGETGISVVEVVGTAEAKAADGTSRPLAMGDSLALGERIQTRKESSITIDIGGNTLGLGENADLLVGKLAEVALKEGQLNAKARADSELTVRSEGSDTSAKTKGGEFAMLSDGKGRVTVATKVGTTKFSAAGKSIEVPEGKLSTSAGDAPSAPQEIPTSLFLKVDNPRKKQRKKTYAVRGKSSPGTMIRVNGKLVEVGADGSFTYRVALEEGPNEVTIESRDALGRKASEKVSVRVDTKGPNMGTKVEW